MSNQEKQSSPRGAAQGELHPANASMIKKATVIGTVTVTEMTDIDDVVDEVFKSIRID